MPLLERLDLSGAGGAFADADWTDPANEPPGYARPFRATGPVVVFDIVGKVDTASTAVEADVGAMTIDAWVGWQQPEVVRANGNPSIRRGQSIVEASGGAPLPTRIRVKATDAQRGGIGHLNIDLAAITVGAIDIIIVSGARPL